MSTYRYDVSEHDGTVYRARIVRDGDEYGDRWRWYWEGDQIAAFVVNYGYRPDTTVLGDPEWSERAVQAWRHEHIEDTGAAGGLDRLAVRLTGNAEAKFICVGLDRGSDLYALAWNGDPDNKWSDEIESLHYGDIYRIEYEEYQPGSGVEGGDWVAGDYDGETYYGEDNANDALAKDFPLDEFPAELFITASA